MHARTFLLRHKSGATTVAGFLFLSTLYFADVLLRASLKAFWFDELFTVYLCRLPSFHATWTAVLNGSDFNPPLFYVLSRASQGLFGEGLIATRLPAILGVWIFCICLYAFTSRRLGRVPGAIAALAPLFTLAHSYAYEARAHGIVLGWCGLMMVCWQRARERANQQPWQINRWVVALAVCYLGALLTHIYAVYLVVPFLLAECSELLRRRKIHLPVIAALALPLMSVAPLFAHMRRTYAAIQPDAQPLSHPQIVIQQSLVSMFGGALGLLLLSFALFAFQRRSSEYLSSRELTFSREELVLGVGLLLLPILGIAGAKLTHGPFFERYFVASSAGFGLLLAQAATKKTAGLSIPRGLLAAMILLVLGDAGLAARATRGADLAQVEPASNFKFSASPSRPLERDGALLGDTSGLDILVTEAHNYLYLDYYAPPEIRRRLWFGAATADDFVLVSDRRLARWTHISLRTTTYQEFFATHDDFLVYGSTDGRFNGSCEDCLQKFLNAGYTLRSVTRDTDNLLEHFSR